MTILSSNQAGNTNTQRCGGLYTCHLGQMPVAAVLCFAKPFEQNGKAATSGLWPGPCSTSLMRQHQDMESRIE